MTRTDLDAEDRELLRSYEQEEWRSVEDLQKEIERLREGARSTLKKDCRVNIRLARRDLDRLKARAFEEGLPYQTLIASVLHKYVNDRYVDRRNLARGGTPAWTEVAEVAEGEE